jgi:Tfp pilus assembly protein FimT
MSSSKAFTMVELVFIVIIIGILAAVIIPKSQDNRLREAADQVVSHIRYTQHLAMMDDKFDPSDTNWYRRRWQIIFDDSEKGGGFSYSIFSDKPTYSGNADLGETAVNPQDPSKLLSGGSSSIPFDHKRATKEMNIENKYGINNVTFSNTCSSRSSRRIVFDYLGRPIKGNIRDDNSSYPDGRLITKQCIITLTNNAGESINITVEPETGFAQVVSP